MANFSRLNQFIPILTTGWSFLILAGRKTNPANITLNFIMEIIKNPWSEIFTYYFISEKPSKFLGLILMLI